MRIVYTVYNNLFKINAEGKSMRMYTCENNFC